MITFYRKVRKSPKWRDNKRSKRGIVSLPKKYIGRNVKVMINGIKGIKKKNLHYN